jgi:signal transduction histidine kinase
MTRSTLRRPWLAAPGLALALAAVFVALEGPSGGRVLNATLAGVGVLLVWSVAVAVRSRYPDRPLGVLLFALATGFALQALVASPNALLFTLARAARPAVEVLLVWVMVAFPSGRLSGWRERALVAASALAILLLWLPAVMLSSSFPLQGPYVSCAPDCPRNMLAMVEQPALSLALHQTFRVAGALILIATAALLLGRLRAASPLMRRTLAPVLLASILRALTMAVFLATGVGALALIFTFWLVPLAIALGLLRGRLYTARALQRLVTGLRSRPDMRHLRDVMAQALDDPSLRVAYWSPDAERWVDTAHGEVSLAAAEAPGRAVRVVADAHGQPVAALMHDAALLEEPMLLEAVAGSVQSVLESHRIESALAGARTSSASAVAQERRRIERDLHDGAQQRLLALRMKLGVTARLLDHDPHRAAALLKELGADVDAAVVELRALAQGIVPPLLVERGLAAALEEAAQRAALPTRTQIEDIGRIDPATEQAVYFCCLEALQNAAKHGGPVATAALHLQRQGDMLHFSIDDQGKSAAGTAMASGGQGLANMRERIAAIGGQLSIQRRPDGGYRVEGSVSISGSGQSARRSA